MPWGFHSLVGMCVSCVSHTSGIVCFLPASTALTACSIKKRCSKKTKCGSFRIPDLCTYVYWVHLKAGSGDRSREHMERQRNGNLHFRKSRIKNIVGKLFCAPWVLGRKRKGERKNKRHNWDDHNINWEPNQLGVDYLDNIIGTSFW